MRGAAPNGGLCIAALLVALLPTAAPAAEITVFAAASLTDALRALGTDYQERSGDRLTFNFGASSDLARQLLAGAPADVFFSADLAQMERLEEAGLVRHADRLDVLSNLLTVIVPEDSTLALGTPRDLLGVKHLALANPEAVPAGVYAKRYLQSVGLWEALLPHVVPTLDVRATRAAVEAGHADAGIVYRTDAAVSKRVRMVLTVPRTEGPSIVYPLAPLAASKQKDAAAALIRHLVGAEARIVYERFGFIVLPAR